MSRLFQIALALSLVGGVFVAAPAMAAVNLELVYSPLRPMKGQATELSLRLTDTSTMKLIQHAEVDVSVFKDGELVFGTGRTHTHSGVFSWFMMLPAAGTYSVRASFLGVPRAEADRYVRTDQEFSLVVSEPGKLVPARVEIKLPEVISLGKIAHIELAVWNREINSLLPHVESLITLLYEGKQVYSGLMHTHSGLLKFSYLFPEKGEYKLIAQFSPTKGAAPAEFLPVVGEKVFRVR